MKNKKNGRWNADDKLGAGLALGLVFGLLLDNLALGLVFGLIFGALPNSKNGR